MRSAARALAAAALLFALGCDRVNDDTYAKVKEGQTLDQVQSLLGSGEQDTTGGFTIGAGGAMGSSSSANSTRQTYVWKDGDRQIVIEFKDSKVAGKRKIGF
jgi:hypothetical protein